VDFICGGKLNKSKIFLAKDEVYFKEDMGVFSCVNDIRSFKLSGGDYILEDYEGIVCFNIIVVLISDGTEFI
jgi:hypothetical protein